MDKCKFHGLSFETGCNWCGEQICEQCIMAHDGRKYCSKCYTKLTKTGLKRFLKRSWGEKPDDKVLNVDPMLNEEELKKKKQMLEIREKAKKILGE
ncbi:hypothetical protein CMO90_02735 [Candidatus Woesearchaeota archaeon]|jgi:hypothetical protein|nr:hypothetical protein [Candidatus Woesearchaeota archaeon]|tara:strand:+ start:454 stop:741 length:288 start_codon:yes stop_codon:yes gene_type:complete